MKSSTKLFLVSFSSFIVGVCLALMLSVGASEEFTEITQSYDVLYLVRIGKMELLHGREKDAAVYLEGAVKLSDVAMSEHDTAKPRWEPLFPIEHFIIRKLGVLDHNGKLFATRGVLCAALSQLYSMLGDEQKSRLYLDLAIAKLRKPELEVKEIGRRYLREE